MAPRRNIAKQNGRRPLHHRMRARSTAVVAVILCGLVVLLPGAAFALADIPTVLKQNAGQWSMINQALDKVLASRAALAPVAP